MSVLSRQFTHITFSHITAYIRTCKKLTRCWFMFKIVYKYEDMPRCTSVRMHLSTVFYKCIACFQSFDRFSRHLKNVQICLRVCKISWVTCHRESCGSNDFVPCAFVGGSWIRKFFSSVFGGSKIFCLAYFVGPKLLLVGANVLLVVVSWVQNFSRGWSVANFVIQRFSFAGCMRETDRKQKYITQSHTTYSIPNRFQQMSL